MKKISLSKAKKNAWTQFSKYIRLRDSLKTVGNITQCKCITCGRIYPTFGKGCIQAGHFIPGRHNVVLFNEEIIFGQCLTKHSFLKTINGYKKIDKIKEGDILSAFNENNFYKETAFVESVASFIPEKLYKIELENGKYFLATPDHKIIVNGKWKKIEELLHNSSDNDIMEL